MGPRICRSNRQAALFISCRLIKLSALHKSPCPGKSGMPLSCKNFCSGFWWCTITCFCCRGDLCNKRTVTVITRLYQQAYRPSVQFLSPPLIPDAFKEKHAAKRNQQECQRNEPLCSYLMNLSLSRSLCHTHLFHLCSILLPHAHKDNCILEAAKLCIIWNQSRKKLLKTYKSKTKSFDFCVHKSSKYIAVWLITRFSSPNLLTTESVNGKEDNYKKQILVLGMWPCVANEWNPSWSFLLVETSNSHKVRALNSTIQAIEFCVLASQGLWPKSATSPMLC
jgi:hypothetical protein